MFTVDVNSFVLFSFSYEFLFRYWQQESPDWPKEEEILSLRAINREYLGGKFWNSMLRRIFGQVDQMGRASGGKGKKRLIKGKGKGKSRLARPSSGGDSATGKMNHFIFL